MSYEGNKRWRENNPEKRKAAKERNYRKGGKVFESGEQGTWSKNIWTAKEDIAILSPNRPSDAELSKKLNRGVRAIQVRRAKLKKQSTDTPRD